MSQRYTKAARMRIPNLPWKSFEIRTRRLVVRPWKVSDYAAWRASCLARLPARNGWDLGPPPAEELTRETWLRRFRRNERLRQADLLYLLGVFHRRTGAVIGFIDLMVLERGRLQWANLGYRIQNQHWGKGYAAEAAGAALRAAFLHLGIHRIEAGIERRNRASRRVAEKLRLRREGTRRGFYYEDGRWLDLDIYATTAEERGFASPAPGVRARLDDHLC